MAKTAVRADTQVKGAQLTLGGALNTYFEGASNAAGSITLNNSAGVPQLTFDAGQSGSGNFQLTTEGDVHVKGNLFVDGMEVVVQEVQIQASEIIADNLTAGNARTDNHTFTGSVLFNVDSTATASNVTIKEVGAGGTSKFKITNSSDAEKFSVVASSGDTLIGGTLGVTGSTTLSGGANVAAGQDLTLLAGAGNLNLQSGVDLLMTAGAGVAALNSTTVAGVLNVQPGANAVVVNLVSTGGSTGTITYTGSTDVLNLNPMSYSLGDGAAADVKTSWVSAAGTGILKWDNAVTGFDFDHKLTVNGDLIVTGSILGPGNPVAGLAQYAVYGVSGSWAGSVWTLNTADSVLGSGLQDEVPSNTYPIYLGPQGAWGGSEQLMPFTVTKDGLTLIHGATEDYTLSKAGGAIKVTFNDAPSNGDRFRAVFSRQK